MPRLVVLALLVPLTVVGGQPGPSYAAAPTCIGADATIVGTPGTEVVGTEGLDVIVSNGAVRVDALGGADLVCITGGAATAVDTGRGDDHVDATGPEPVVDSVSTGAGNDIVLVGASGEPMSDVVDTGDNRDLLMLYGLPGPGSLDTGGNGDVIYFRDRSGADWRIDNRAGEMSAGGQTMSLNHSGSFFLGFAEWASLVFVGGPGEDSLETAGNYHSNRDAPVVADMGGGEDRLLTRADQVDILHGGKGDDALELVGFLGRRQVGSTVDADLLDGTVKFSGLPQAKVTSFGDVSLLGFAHTTARLGPGSDRIRIRGCRATVHAGPGSDLIRFAPPGVDSGVDCPSPPRSQSLTAYGEGGSDKLQGGPGNDILVGGTGDDIAVGRRGTDVCSAEVRRECERR